MKIGKMRLGQRACALLGAVALICAGGSLPARATDSPDGFAAPAAPAAQVLRTAAEGILSPEDESLYRRIFALQREGSWAAADALIDRLDDDVLLGTVLAQRYLHPTAYVSRGPELRQWLSDFPDLPDAAAIHKMAKARSGSAPVPAPDDLDFLTGGGGIDGVGSWLRGQSLTHLSAADAEAASRLTAQFRNALRHGRTLNAKEILEDSPLTRLLLTADSDRLRGALGFSYFLDNRDDLALDWAAPAADRSRERAPQAAWTAGLASWRLKKFDAAERYFGIVANSSQADPWTRAGGAYWAARAALHARHPQAVNGWLDMAADHPRTFYGLIARKALGLPIGFGWDAETISQSDRETLAEYQGGRRTLALLQVGEPDRAEAELRMLFPNVDPVTQQAALGVAEAGGLASLAIRLSAEIQRRDGVVYDNARYPVPHWKPSEGWQVDRALVYAFARQESGFDPEATSPAGARGLMQLMPATARAITGSAELASKAALLDPGVNLSLGQRYLQILMEDGAVDRNLFFLAAAYNGGPGNLAAWSRKANYNNDPLLFVESLSSRETRLFIERIMANLWIYRLRLNQDTPSLDAVASGRWPQYQPLDRFDMRIAAFGGASPQVP